MPSLSSLSSIICSSPPNARACSSCAAVCPSYNSQSLHCEERFLMAPLLCHSSPNQLTQEQCPSNAPIDLEEPGGPRPRIHRRRAAARPRVIGGSASPRSPGFFQKTSPVFKSFSEVYYARIVKSPLISALPLVSSGGFSPFRIPSCIPTVTMIRLPTVLERETY